jgi:hypothetical protein
MARKQAESLHKNNKVKRKGWRGRRRKSCSEE